jgi:hypothetical protein
VFTIRPATIDDVGTLLDLIRGLAQYAFDAPGVGHEGDPEGCAVRVTPGRGSTLRSRGQPTGRVCIVLPQLLGKRGLWLEDIFMRPKHRRKAVRIDHEPFEFV